MRVRGQGDRAACPPCIGVARARPRDAARGRTRVRPDGHPGAAHTGDAGEGCHGRRPRARGARARAANSPPPPSWSAVQTSKPSCSRTNQSLGCWSWRPAAVRAALTGTAARVGLNRILIGSVTRELAAHSPCPLIAVPRAAALEEPGPVLAGYDGSDHGLRAARHAAALAAQLKRDLVLVHVEPGDEVVRQTASSPASSTPPRRPHRGAGRRGRLTRRQRRTRKR